MKTEILRKLRTAQNYVSGQQLCNDLGVSRTAVWKCINQLKEAGYGIDAVPNKGYHITKYPDLITDTELMSILPESGVVKNVVYFEETDSTNNQAKKQAEKGVGEGTLFVTECQKAGRGRRGRQWISPAGSGIWMSLVLRPEIPPQYAPMLTIVSAVAVVEAIRKETDVDCSIKWPNDVVVAKRKVCGILTELSAEMEQINYVVVGIGINVNTEDFDDSISSMASSLFLQTGKHLKRSQLIANFSEAFEKYYQLFLKTCDLSGIIEVYNQMLINKDQQVKIIEKDTELIATALGINAKGELIVRLEDGTVREIVAGEVSVRGLYGYV